MLIFTNLHFVHDYLPLSAVVICPPTDDFPTRGDLNARLENEPGWKHVSVNGCEVLLKTSEVVSN